MRHTLLACLLAAALACTTSEADRLDVVTRDTLPGGIEQVTSPGPTAWRDSTGFALVEDLRHTPEPGSPGELINPTSLAVDGAGRIYVADQRPAVIKVFEPDGSFSHAIGGEGAGPGEFESPFLAIHGDSLVAHDPAQSRTSVFALDGTFLKSWASNCCFWSAIAVDRQGLLNLPAMSASGPGTLAVTRFRLDGTAVDTVHVPHEGEPTLWELSLGPMQLMTPVPFSPEPHWTYHPDGGYVIGFADRYRLARLGPAGDTVLVFGRAWSAEPIPQSVREEAVEVMVERLGRRGNESAIRAVVKVVDLPATAPAFAGIQVDGLGRIWVRSGLARDGAPARFDVFAPGGAWLGPVTTPGPLPGYGAVTWTAEAIVMVQESDEGLPTLVRWRFPAGGAP